MIVDRYTPVDLSGLIPDLRLEMEPELRELERLLSDDELFAVVKADLSKRYANSATRGRHSTPVEVILRMLVLRRLYDWSYEATERTSPTPWCCGSSRGCTWSRRRMTRP